MTVLEVIRRSTEFLAKKGVESPRLQAELLLAHRLQMPRMKLYLEFERALNEPELESIRELVKRRGQREPLQHIVGSTSFCGFEISVNRHVLIPRAETELLAERGWNFLNSFSEPNHLNDAPVPGGVAKNSSIPLYANGACTPKSNSPAVLDFGTGSGCLAIALAIKAPEAVVFALDVSAESLEIARQNASRHPAAQRIQFYQGDGFAALPKDARFNLIVSNPPYIPSEEIGSLEPEVRDFDPLLALDGGPDGLGYYRRLAAEAGPFLLPEGNLMVEFGDGQAPAISQIFENQKWIVETIAADYTHRPRILIARWTAY